MEEIFKRWLRDTKNLSDNTIRNYTNRLKNIIPSKLVEVNFKEENVSLYDLSIEELKNINELFEKNIYDFTYGNNGVYFRRMCFGYKIYYAKCL